MLGGNIEEFTDELSTYVESLLSSWVPKPKKHEEDWQTDLRLAVRSLVEKHCNIKRSRGPSFVIGDESSSTSASLVGTDTLSEAGMQEAGVQVDLPMSTQKPQPELCISSPSLNSQTEESAVLLEEMRRGTLKHRMLEQRCSPAKAVELRRKYFEEHYQMCLDALPHQQYEYAEVKDACCENVIGFVPLPTGIAGPLNFDGELVPIPMSTTEGALIASVSRGCLSINESIQLFGEDAFSVELIRDGMTRAPVLEFPRVREAAECLRWLQRDDSFARVKRTFEETSSFAQLQRVDAHLEGTYLFLRFVASTGDAMGMNMVTKGTGRVLDLLKWEFPLGRLISISGNLCVDKKPSAINWIEGRGKSVVAEAILPALVVERVLKTAVDKLVKLAHAKLLVGSSTAVTIGGSNAHAANVVAAMFLATGQDAAQVVSSSMCLTQLSKRTEDGALHITCTMNCLEVGTIGGGTVLTPQGASLEMLGCRRVGLRPGQNAERFARLICATVLAGELSLLASQCNEGELEKTHLRLNRSNRNLMLSSGSCNSLILTGVAASPLASPLQQNGVAKKSISMSTLKHVAIPEHLPLPPTKIDETRGVVEFGKEPEDKEKRIRKSTITKSTELYHGECKMRDSRSRSSLSQTSSKPKKGMGSGHMPCGPL